VGPWCLVGADFDMPHACVVAKWAFVGGTKELIEHVSAGIYKRLHSLLLLAARLYVCGIL